MNDAELSSNASPIAAARKRSYGAFALRAGLGAAVIAVMLWRFNPRPVIRALGHERPDYFAAAIALYLAGQVMSSWRWQLLARLNAIGGRWREYLAYYFVGVFTNLFVPGLIGGDAARALYLGRRHNRIAAAIASVVADRLVGLLALFWFAAVAVLTLGAVALPPAIVRPTVIAGVAALAGWLMAPIGARLVPRLSVRVAGFADPILPYLRRPLATIPAIILSLILQASLAGCQYLLALGLGLKLPLAAFMLCVPIANVFASLPLTLNGLGVREAAYLVLFGYAGVAQPDAIALGLLWFASTMIGGLSGILAFVTTKMPVPPIDADHLIPGVPQVTSAPGNRLI
ncbi:MAG: flippase-like domain-containing protein [Candidatus Binataceae bacterium]|nr:flippase-like domain-containing protein [Candidatus Binataceae bacterium]